MKVLGINAVFHDPSAAIVVDGVTVAALEEETDRGDDLPLAELADALDALALFVDSDSLADWNDDVGRTQADVLGVLGAAAEAAVPRRLDA